MKRKKTKIIDMPYADRLSLATHYQESAIQPNHDVHVGYESGGCFQSLYIDMHKSEAKRKRLILSDKSTVY